MIYLVLADGFEEIEALTPVDILRRGGAEVLMASLDGSETVTGSHGITVKADISAYDIGEDMTMLIFPGGMPGSDNIDHAEITDKLLKTAEKCGAHIAAICAAPKIIGNRGLLRGKRAVCYPGFEKYLKERTECSERVVTDGKITTAIGMGAALEFAHELLKIAKDSATADHVVASVYPK